jgi:hypothetical protein
MFPVVVVKSPEAVKIMSSSARRLIKPPADPAPVTFRELSPPTVTARSPPTVEVERVTALLLVNVALPEVPEVFKLTAPVNTFDVLSRVIAWSSTSVVKLDVPVIVKVPVSVIAPPEVTLKFPLEVVLPPKTTPPVPASTVKSLKEEVDEKFTALPLAVAIKVSGVEVEVTPSTVIVPLVALPIVRLPALIWARSELLREKSPEAPPSPIVPASETCKVVPAVPELIAPVELKDMLLEVMVNALFVVLSVLAVKMLKSPVPLPSESELKPVVPLVVRLEESVIPFSALTVRPWKVESDVPKVTEEPEAVEVVARHEEEIEAALGGRADGGAGGALG